jgi:hypothetical protein
MFETELAYYSEHKDELLQHHENQFVIIRGNEFGGAYSSDLDAYKAGLAKWGNVSFLIKQVRKEEEVVRFPALTLGVLNAHLA